MTFSQANPNDLIIVFTGVVLLFRRVVKIEHYHKLRVFLITSVLSCVLIYFFGALSSKVIPPFDYRLQFDSPDSQSEF